MWGKACNLRLCCGGAGVGKGGVGAVAKGRADGCEGGGHKGGVLSACVVRCAT